MSSFKDLTISHKATKTTTTQTSAKKLDLKEQVNYELFSIIPIHDNQKKVCGIILRIRGKENNYYKSYVYDLRTPNLLRVEKECLLKIQPKVSYAVTVTDKGAKAIYYTSDYATAKSWAKERHGKITVKNPEKAHYVYVDKEECIKKRISDINTAEENKFYLDLMNSPDITELKKAGYLPCFQEIKEAFEKYKKTIKVEYTIFIPKIPKKDFFKK